MVETLQKQIESFQIEHSNLRDEINSLVKDNKLLSSKLSASLECSRCASSIFVTSEFQNSKKTLVEDTLKRQLELSLREKDSAIELWENSLKIIDQLEQELNLYENKEYSFMKKTDHKKIKHGYERRIENLESQLKSSQIKLTETIQTSTTSLSKKSEELNKILTQQNKTLTGIKQLEEEVHSLQAKSAHLVKKNETLGKENLEKDKLIFIINKSNDQSKRKVSEAVDLVETALLEKDAALLREKVAKDEAQNLQKILSRIIDEAGEKVIIEVESVKSMYETKYWLLQDEINNLQKDLTNRKEKVNELSAKCDKLENELDKYRSQLDNNGEDSKQNYTKVLLLEKNLEASVQKMLIAERKNIQMQTQTSQLKEEHTLNIECFRIELDRKENDKRILQHTVRKLKNELQVSNSKLLQVAEKVEEVNERIKMMESEIKKENYVKDLQSEERFSATIREVETANQKILNDLMGQLEAQIEINKAWRKEVPDLTDKLERRHKELREEIIELKKRNKELKQELYMANEKLYEYHKYTEDLQEYFKSLPSGLKLDTGDTGDPGT